MQVLVTGATGFVGSNLVPALIDKGHDVKALVRDPTKYEGPDDSVEVVGGDLLKKESLDGVFDGIEAAYYLVHSMRAGKDFAEMDKQAARNFVDSAQNVNRVVYLGGLGETSDDLSKHLKSRREVEDILSQGDYDLTSLRAAIIVGGGSASFQMVRQLVEKLPVMVTPEWVRTDCQPIAIRDVIGYLVGVLEVPETAGRTLEIGGPEVLTYQDMMKRTAREIGYRYRPLIIPVPVLSPQLSSYWVDLVTDVPRNVAHPLILGLRNPVVVHDETIRELIPLDLTPFDVAVRRAVEEDE
ncbi:MAG: NAD(P)H-binding protein [Halobacteria archaeon]|nr:NAD(P)H-binding protein [Halobacteria archaeon]